jgi:hypothetical protein
MASETPRGLPIAYRAESIDTFLEALQGTVVLDSKGWP